MANPQGKSRERKCVAAVLEEHDLRENHHFDGDQDYFKILLEYLKTQIPIMHFWMVVA